MKYYFSIDMTADEFFPYYQGRISSIVVQSETGQKVQFPAMHLRKHITPAGVTGRFCLETADNKFISLTRVFN